MRSNSRRAGTKTWVAALAVVLAGCGGGGGGDSAPPPAATTGPCAAGGDYAVVTFPGASSGAGAAAAVLGCTGPIGDPQWTQTAGPATVPLLAQRTQAIHFEPPLAGRYRFALGFTAPDGSRRSEDVAVDVPASSTVSMALRNSQAVRAGGNVSVRFWPLLGAGDAVQSVTWQQVEGPAVALNTSDPYVALFVAPAVARDTLIRLRATLRTTSGGTASDEAIVVVEAYPQAGSGDASAVWGGSHVSRVHPYRAGSPYAGVLQRCVYDSALRESTLCPISELPFLAQTAAGGVPSVEQVMDRVLVSHDWLGAAFEDLLRNHDTRGDFRRMLASVTAVVLGTQVRPSFYYALPGAIYLDADNFWRTPEERDTVNEAPDFRSDFGNALNYDSPWRYVRGSASIFRAWDTRSRLTRTLADVADDSSWLLYHELGHALDFLPPSEYAGLAADTTRSPWGVIGPRYNARQLASDTVSAASPLQSSIMRGLGQVKFQGVTATSAQIAYTPNDVAGFFSADRATDEYAYSTTLEDIAMALEEALMSHRLGIRRDVAVTDKIGPTTTGSTLIVRWGQRGRVGDAAVKPRVRSIVALLTPWVDLAQIDSLPAPIAMRVGESWTANLALPARSGPFALDGSDPAWLDDWKLARAAKRLQHHRHVGVPRLPGR